MPSLEELHQKTRELSKTAPELAAGATVPPLKVWWLPGSALKGIIFGTFGEAPCERCTITAEKMDKNGVAWCLENIDDLSAELVENVKQFPKRYLRVLAHFGDALGVATPKARKLITQACDLASNPSTKGQTIRFVYQG